MAPLRIEVNGYSVIRLPAERAVVDVSVQSEGESQDEVSQNVASTSAQLRELLTGLAGKDVQGSRFKYDDEGNKKGRIHEASVSFEASFRDFTKLGSVATVLSTMEHVNIRDISWQLTDETKLKFMTKSRQQAVREAVKKAKDYSEALGRSSAPPVIEIRDTAAGSSASFESRMVPMAMFSAGSGVQQNLQFVPGDVSLECSVMIICQE